MNAKALQKLSYGLYLISTEHEGKAAGCVVNTFTQATSSPARVTVTINKGNFTTGMIQKSGKFTAVVLAQDAGMELIGRFGFRSSSDLDKFEGWKTAVGKNGVPYVAEQVVAQFECRVIGELDARNPHCFSGRPAGRRASRRRRADDLCLLPPGEEGQNPSQSVELCGGACGGEEEGLPLQGLRLFY